MTHIRRKIKKRQIEVLKDKIDLTFFNFGLSYTHHADFIGERKPICRRFLEIQTKGNPSELQDSRFAALGLPYAGGGALPSIR